MANRVKVEATLQANKAHQEQVKSYIDRLEAELAIVDGLIKKATINPEEPPESSEFGIIEIPGASKPTSLILQSGLLSEASPFNADAKWRETYERLTTLNPMKGKEQEALRRAVRGENQRISVLAAQAQGKPASLPDNVPATFYEKNREGLDWTRIANRVSDSLQSVSRRKPEECEIRWIGYLHPDINKSTWTAKEVEDLKKIVDELNGDGPIDWTAVSVKLGTGRSPMDCMVHGAQRENHVWDAESDQRLLECIRMYGENNWALVAMSVSEDATVHQCQKRFYDTLDPSLKHGSWSDDEDAQLLRAVNAFSAPGQSNSMTSIPWQDVALFVPGRTNNQCREHYQTKFKSKGAGSAKSWSDEDDVKLREAVVALPKGQWKEVSERVGGGKTAEMCQKRFEVLSRSTGVEGPDDEMHSETDRPPPKKRARKSAAPKPRGRKAKSAEVKDGQTSDGQASTPGPAETPSVKEPAKRRVRPQPGMFKKGQNMFGDVDKSAAPSASGSGEHEGTNRAATAEGGQPDPPNQSQRVPREEDETQIDDEQVEEPAKKRGRPKLSDKARGKQKATAAPIDLADAQQQTDQISTVQKKRPGRKPKAKTTEPESVTETPVDLQPSLGEGADGGNTTAPMDVDEPEPSNRRRSARLKGTKN